MMELRICKEKNTLQRNQMRNSVFMIPQSFAFLSLWPDSVFAVQNFQVMEKFNAEISKSS